MISISSNVRPWRLASLKQHSRLLSTPAVQPRWRTPYTRLRPDTGGDAAHTVVTGATAQEAVPPAPTPDRDVAMRLADFIVNGQGRVLVLSGAGLSTESGIPDYRTSEMQRKVINPIKHHEFVSDPRARQRYWARSALGYERLTPRTPHLGHHSLAALQKAGLLLGEQITQNVDGLLGQAGCNALELHGSIHSCTCMACGTRVHRAEHQKRLRSANHAWEGFREDVAGSSRPDGDTELSRDVIDKFVAIECHECGGIIKPDVVFFGGKVPEDVTTRATDLVGECRALLVLGSSVATWSAYRLVRQAHEAGKAVGAVTYGQTRADDLWHFKAQTMLGPTLATVSSLLSVPLPPL